MTEPPRHPKKQTLKYREHTDGHQRGMKQVKGVNSTLTMMSTEQCIELLNHYNVHLKLIQHFINYTGIKIKNLKGTWVAQLVKRVPYAQVTISGSWD